MTDPPNGPGLTLYHRTDADLITAHGLRDGHGTYLTGTRHSGVFLSDYPLNCNEGAKGNQLISVTIPNEADVADYEWIEEGKPYREWCIPAAVVNRYPRIAIDEERRGRRPHGHAV